MRKSWVKGLNDGIYKAAYKKAAGMVALPVSTEALIRDVGLVAEEYSLQLRACRGGAKRRSRRGDFGRGTNRMLAPELV